MSENQIDNVEDVATDVALPSELDMLRQRAKLMNLKVPGNISVEKLKKMIEDHLAKEASVSSAGSDDASGSDDTETAQAPEAIASEAPKPAAQPKALSLRQQMLKEQMKLVRLRITNLDPKKKDLPGEIITVANEYLGTVRKYVPFGEVTDNGYHVPYCIYTVLKDRTFLSIKTRKDRKTGTPIVETQDAREFALEVLPPLTEKELAELAAAQRAAGGLD